MDTPAEFTAYAAEAFVTILINMAAGLLIHYDIVLMFGISAERTFVVYNIMYFG